MADTSPHRLVAAPPLAVPTDVVVSAVDPRRVFDDRLKVDVAVEGS